MARIYLSEGENGSVLDVQAPGGAGSAPATPGASHDFRSRRGRVMVAAVSVLAVSIGVAVAAALWLAAGGLFS